MSRGTTTLIHRFAPPTPADTMRVAAIDIGSNSIHMIVGQTDGDGAVTTLWRMKEMVGLGRLSFTSRRLTREAMDRAITALQRFCQAAHQRECEKIIAVATSAVREARNGGDLIERCKRELGLRVRLLSGRDEARMIYLAVRHAMPLKNEPCAIVDIGGGSVELIVGDGRRAQLLETLKLGAARMTARFVDSDPISKPNLRDMTDHYDQQLGPVCERIRELEPARLIGTSGTIENLAAMCKPAGDAASTIERAKFDKLLHFLIKSDAAERAQVRGLDDKRRDQILAGALVVGELFKRLNFKRMTLCPAALREGILLDYLNRNRPDMEVRRDVPDPRRRSVIDLARRCNWHKTHSEQVARLCMMLFDELRSLHGLGEIERELIEYAALLHDIGWHIGRRRHHKHSMYLILNGDLRNFTDEEIAIVANIARYHRKRPPRLEHDAYAALSSSARRTVDVGVALLRIADGLDRSHGSVIDSLSCRVGKSKVRCTLVAKSDAQLEVWGARRKKEWFEQTFGRPISFKLASP